MEEQISNAEDCPVVVVVNNKEKLREVIANSSLEFDEWTSLISAIEKAYPDSLEMIRLVYDFFLSEFPLCYGYWRKYVNHVVRLSTCDKAVEIFERAVLSATYYVDLWVDYCNFGSMFFEDPSDVRRLFKRALSFVGKDYFSHALWDKYIEFEFSLKHWSSLAYIYIQALRFPTKKLHHYYDSFKKLVEIWETELEPCGNSSLTESEPRPDSEASIQYNQENIVCIIKDLLDPSIGSARSKVLQDYKSTGVLFFQEASTLNEKINCFEIRIKRRYFHAKPLDTSQLENWHHYLDFAELHVDFDWAVKLYERCLIPCANYPEFWMRYVEFVESKGGREIANLALDRATQIFLKRASVIHLFNARFKEYIGDAASARTSILQCSRESDSDFVENVIMRANMEKRLGNFIAASSAYKEAIEVAAEMEKWHILPILYVHFSRLKYMTTDNEDAARDILIDGIKHMPYSKLLIEELIKFAIAHGGARHLNVIDAIVGDAISPRTDVSQGLSAKDGEDISILYLEFVDLCGTVHDIRMAWNRHIKLFSPSVRVTAHHPVVRIKQWKVDAEAEEPVVSLPHQPTTGDSSSHCLVQSSLEEKKLSSPQRNDIHGACPVTDQSSDQKLPLSTHHDTLHNQLKVPETLLLEKHIGLSDQEKVDVPRSGEYDNISQVPPKVSEPSGDVIKPDVSLDLDSQVAKGTENTQASLQSSEEHDAQKQFGQDSELDLKPPSLERLSLDPQYAKTPRSVCPTSFESGAPQDDSFSDGGLMKIEPAHRHSLSNQNALESCQNGSAGRNISSTIRVQATVSAQNNHWHLNPSFPASNRNVTSQEFPRPRKLGNRGQNWHQKNNSDRFRRDSKYGFHGHSHKRLHKQQQSSPQWTYQAADQMPTNQDYQSQGWSSQDTQVQQGAQVQSQYAVSSGHTNVTAPQPWPIHNLQQPNLSPSCQSQPQMAPISMQNNEQHGNLLHNQAYNQMWQQYYYLQQQEQLLWQQQQLHQQPQQLQLLQQQYQQQLLQMQYLQQQPGQHVQAQMQQQQLPYEHQQLQQLQLQHPGQQQQQQLLQQQSHQQEQLGHVQQQQLGLPQSHLQLQQHYHQQEAPSMQQHPCEHEQEQSKCELGISQVQD